MAEFPNAVKTWTDLLDWPDPNASLAMSSDINSVYDEITAMQTYLRKPLTSSRTYYVRTDGNDINTGLMDSSAGAFLTIQKAVDVAATLDLGIFNVLIQVADGTYTGAVQLKRTIGSGIPTIQGNITTPANCVNNVSSGNCFLGTDAGYWIIKGFKTVAGSGSAFYANGLTNIDVYNIDFGACANYHIYAVLQARITIKSICTISGSASRHIYADAAGIIYNNNFAHVISGTIAFTYFANANRSGMIYSAGCTWAGGTVTGKRYSAALLSWINTGGGGENYFPGDSAGTTATGGFYA